MESHCEHKVERLYSTFSDIFFCHVFTFLTFFKFLCERFLLLCVTVMLSYFLITNCFILLLSELPFCVNILKRYRLELIFLYMV